VTRRPDGGFAVLFKSPGGKDPFGQYTPDSIDDIMALVASAAGLTVFPLMTDGEFAAWRAKNSGGAGA